jgi:hypothetical protein
MGRTKGAADLYFNNSRDDLDIPTWEASVRTRFSFLAAMDADEQRWAVCNARDHQQVLDALADGGCVPR